MSQSHKLGDDAVKVVIALPRDLRERVDAVLPLVQKEGWKGRAMPWKLNELAREGVRQVVEALEAGRFKPLPEKLRGGEAKILKVETR
jgi:hypothetical protein